MDTLRWGIIGAGRIAESFARDIAAVPNAQLVAVAARSGERAARFAARHGVARSHAGYEALYQDAQVDAVYVATPHSLHLAHCSDALTAGKAVLCEKPLVLDPPQCERLISHAGTSGGYLMEGMWTWFLPAIRRARQWLDAGRIGELLHIKADFGYPLEYSETLREYDARLGGGSVLEMGIYPVALARYFLPGDPRRIEVMGRIAANGVEDDVSLLMDYGRATATLGTSFRCKLQNWAYLIGTDGYIAIPDFWRASRCDLYQLDQRVDRFDDGRTTLGFDYQIAAVSADILGGARESPVIPLATSLALQRDMASIRQLARGGRSD